MNVDEAREAKRKLEQDIAEMLREFTEETGVAVDRVYVDPVSIVGSEVPQRYIVEIKTRV